jgi:hypothetical protein
MEEYKEEFSNVNEGLRTVKNRDELEKDRRTKRHLGGWLLDVGKGRMREERERRRNEERVEGQERIETNGKKSEERRDREGDDERCWTRKNGGGEGKEEK